MTRGLMIALTCMGIALSGCATTFAMHDDASSSAGAASPTTTSSGARPPNNFGSSTIPHFGRQAP